MKWALGAVVLAAGLSLGWRARNTGMAGEEIDPVGRISAQDEAVYAHSALRMARQGGWLTPMFLERYSLYKPPLLMWCAERRRASSAFPGFPCARPRWWRPS